MQPKATSPRPRRRIDDAGNPVGRETDEAAHVRPHRPDRPDRDKRRAPDGAPDAAPATATHMIPPRVGEWLWTCRAGSERDVIEEHELHGVSARTVQPGLVASQRRPTVRRNGKPVEIELTFARQGMPVEALCGTDADALADLLAPKLKRIAALHVFSPDSDAGNRLAGNAAGLQQALLSRLRDRGVELVSDGPGAFSANGLVAQVCLLDWDHVALGVLPARLLPSLHPGGRLRVALRGEAPARSARKLAEALIWLGHGPEPGEVCVDLGAAPGGWSQILLERRCHVVAVDPGALAPAIARRVEHLRINAFTFAPEIPADWVLCDMAYRPLEVAGLLAKWGRRHWARFLLCNFKLPMKRRVEMLGRLREILETGGWTGLRFRQLYHDRDEVTVWGWRGFGTGSRPLHRSSATSSPEADDERPAPSPSRSAPAPQRSSKGRTAPAAKGRAPLSATGRTPPPAKRAGQRAGERPEPRRSQGPKGPQRPGRPQDTRGPKGPKGAKGSRRPQQPRRP